MSLRLIVIGCLIFLSGCPSANKPLPPLPPAESVGPLRIVIVDDTPLAAAIQREWTARTGDQIEVRRVSETELLNENDWNADAVIYPPGLIGELATKRRIIAIPAETINAESFDRRGLLTLSRQYEMRWGEETYAFALSAPRLALLYRADLLEKVSQEPPQTWDEYRQLAEILHDRGRLGDLAPAEDQPWSGTIEPWAEHWRGEMVLARAASSIQRRGQLSTLFEFATMQALLDTPPVVAAMENMQQTADFQPDDRLSIDPAEARRRLLQGECGMALTWLPVPYDPNQRDTEPGEPLPLGVAPLPGSAEVYDHETKKWLPRENGLQSVPLVGFAGRVGSVTATCSRRREAFDLLMLLAGPEWSVDVARRSAHAHPFRRQHLRNLRAWLPTETDADTVEQCAEYLDQLDLNPLVLVSPRIPGRARYLSALDASVDKLLKGEATSEQAAAEAATAWNAVTEDLGPTDQRAAYRQSAGIDF